jgi:hypothetical protein
MQKKRIRRKPNPLMFPKFKIKRVINKPRAATSNNPDLSKNKIYLAIKDNPGITVIGLVGLLKYSRRAVTKWTSIFEQNKMIEVKKDKGNITGRLLRRFEITGYVILRENIVKRKGRVRPSLKIIDW